MSDPIEPGIYPNMPYERHRGIGLSKTAISDLLRSPLHYIDKKRHPERYPERAPLVFGNAVHTYLLDPQRFLDLYIVASPDANRNTNDGLDALAFDLLQGVPDPRGYDGDTSKQGGKRDFVAWLQERCTKTIIGRDDFERIQWMAESFSACKTISNLFAGEKAEQWLFWQDEETGLLKKAGLDHYKTITTPNGPVAVIAELKTSADASYESFSRDIAKFHYDVQSAMFEEGVRALMDMRDVWFLFGVVETSPPFACAVYKLDPESLETGRRKVRYATTLYKQCLDTDEWPGYPDMVTPISMPKWALSSDLRGLRT